MGFITQFPLGDDVAIVLLALVALSAAALVTAFVLPKRWSTVGALTGAAGGDAARGEEAEDADDAPAHGGGRGRKTPDDGDETQGDADETQDEKERVDPAAALRAPVRSLLINAVTLSLWVGIPVLGLALLITGTANERLGRLTMILLGLALGAFGAWLGQRILLEARGLAPAQRPVTAARVGGIQVAAALAVAAGPIAVIVWVLRQGAGPMLIALAAGTAISALAVRAIGALADSSASSAALLAGSNEMDLSREDPANIAAPALEAADTFRHGAGRSAQIIAVAAVAGGVAVNVGVPVLATEGILVPMLALGIALAAALIAMLMPRIGMEGREAAAQRIAGLIPTLLAGAGLVAAAALWLPSRYANLRFDAVGMDTFTDPAIVGPEPQPRDAFTEQIEQAIQDMGQFISSTDESRQASAFLDVLTLHGTSPNVLVAVALGLGVVAGLCAQLLAAQSSAQHGNAVRRAARTSRTGGALGAASGLGTAALWAGLILSVGMLVLGGINVLSAGVPLLAMTLSALAGLGALVTVGAHAGSQASEAVVDRAGTEEGWRQVVRGRSAETSIGLHLAGALGALGLIGPVTSAVEGAPRAATVWEDRALHAMTPMSLGVVGGIGFAVVTIVMISAFLLDGGRRLGATAVMETRTSFLEEHESLPLPDLLPESRRSALVALAVAALMPLVVGFGLGPAAVPAFVATVIVAGAGAAVLAVVAAGPMISGVHLIESGRYGGPGSWAHGGALNNAALGTALRGAVGEVLVPAVALSALVSAMAMPVMVGLVADGTNVYLRLGIAVLALLAIGACWLYAVTAPEPDLEDADTTVQRPLFSSRAEETDDDLSEMNWETEEDQRPSTRRRR